MGFPRLFLLLFLGVAFPLFSWGERRPLVMATTTSVEQTGLLAALLPPFERESGREVRVVAVGTGQALRLAQEGNADLVLVHHRKAEEAFVRDGHGIKRIPIFRNRFILIGPTGDPAGVRNARSAVEAFRLLAQARSPFVSRGDRSGTHLRELELWELTRGSPGWPSDDFRGPHYFEAGAGMEAALRMAHQKEAYCLTDEGTFEALADRLSLERLYAGDPILQNVYSVIAVNPARHKGVNAIGARRLIDYLVSDPGARTLVETFKRTRDGRPLFSVIPPEERDQL